MALTVVQLLPALRSGGVERGVLEIGQALVAAGHRSLVISAGGPLVEPLEAAGSEHIVLPIGRKSIATFRYAATLRRIFEEEQVNVVHARSRLPAWVAWRALKKASPRPSFVTTLHGLHSVSRYSSIMARGDRVIAVSEAARTYLETHFHRWSQGRVIVIPRGIDQVEFPRGYRPSGNWLKSFEVAYPDAVGKQRLLLAGRWGRRKGHEPFVRLLSRLKAKGRDCVGLIAGGETEKDQAYRLKIRRLADQLGVADALIELGQRDDMRDVYAISDVVLSLSEKPESFGRTVLEALALGRPVVGYSHGGVEELLQRYYPSGAVTPLSSDSLLVATEQVLNIDSQVPVLSDHRLADMQASTLAIYSELADSASTT